MKQTLAHVWHFLNLPKNIQLFIMRFVNDAFLVGVTGVILNDKNEILLLKHTYRQTPWSLPGGYLKAGEHPKKGIEREVFEESGFKVTIEKIIKTVHDPQTAKLDISCYGKYINGDFTSSAEVSDYGFYLFENLPDIGKKQKKLIEETLRKEKKFPLHSSSFFNRFTTFFKTK